MIDNSRALVVYVPPKNSFHRWLLKFKDKLSSLLRNAFLTRRILLMYMSLIYVCGLFFGLCLAKNDFALPLISSALCYDLGYMAYSTVFSVIILTGFTVFGRIASLIFDASVSTFMGVIMYRFLYDYAEYSSFIVRSASFIGFSALLILFSTEVFLFTKRAYIGKSAFSFKACLKYLCISNLFMFLTYILFIYIF